MNTALEMNSALYERLRACLASVCPLRHPRATLRLARTLANFASFNHPGRFCDGAIDNRLLAIGNRLSQLPTAEQVNGYRLLAARNTNAPRRRVLHVTTSVHRLGGVSPLIANWIRNDRESQHTVVVTDQRGQAERQGRLYPRFLEAIVENDGYLYLLPSNLDICQRAMATRWIRDRHADLILLHHYPEDFVPLLAFAKPGGAPVAVVHSSDHNFWAGSAMTDTLINLRHISLQYGRDRRAVEHNLCLPTPLEDKPLALSAAQARRQLGIAPSALVLLSIGRDVKYQPYRDRDFMKTATRIVSAVDNAHLYIVGYSHRGVCHERIHTLGPVASPELYQAAADIYLEGFPFGSQTALLESALAGLPAVLAFAPLVDLLVTNDQAVNSVLVRPRDEAEYIAQALRLLRDVEYRRHTATALSGSVREAHLGPTWRTNLSAVYEAVQQRQHRPAPIPETDCHREVCDLELAEWCLSTQQQWLTWNEWLDTKYYHYPPQPFDVDFLLHNTLVDMERSGYHREALTAFARTLPLAIRKSRSLKGVLRSALALLPGRRVSSPAHLALLNDL
ncbi:MAG: glycosyltransferase [Planctomycetales bacterium]|nr:glycosyltransferase [Planctomycetales bacterium]